MPEIVGHVDARNRPLVSIEIPGRDDPLLAHIYTGFNGYLFVHQTMAQQLGFVSTGQITKIELADHTPHPAYFAECRIAWLGELLDIDVVVTTTNLSRAMVADEPMALIGTALLNPHKLTIDFATRRVLIAQGD